MDPVAIRFADAGEPARIDYSVPLPGTHTGRRIVELDLELSEDDFTDLAFAAGEVVRVTDPGEPGGGDEEVIDPGDPGGDEEEVIVEPAPEDPGGPGWEEEDIVIDELRARDFFLARAHAAGIDAERLRQLEGHADAIAEGRGEDSLSADGGGADRAGAATDRELLAHYLDYLEHLRAGVLMVPATTWSGEPILVSSAADPDPEPRLFLVERYGVSSFLGDYGMGRTIKTFTLLPGESTTISVKTWQSTQQSIKESSSIIDSHERSARDRFGDKVQKETTDKATESRTSKWHVEASAKASWGFGSAKVSGGASGEYHSGREQFARQASEATREHASEASSKRELSVSSSSERTEETGTETLVERTISNANMRRVLNFVFRELNQQYTTKFHLKDISIGFTNNRLNSWREVPLSGLRVLLEEVIVSERIDEVAQRILKVAGTVFDREDVAVPVLDRLEISPDGTGITVEAAATDEHGEYPPPTERAYYRFRRGPLAQQGENNPVDGVLLSENSIVMRTDSVIVEALLGQADALDPYAMEIQRAAADEQTLGNERERLLQRVVSDLKDEEARPPAAAALFGPVRDGSGDHGS